MPQHRNPDFRHLPEGLVRIFGAQAASSFFGLPQWYDLMARFGVPEGTDVCVFTDERPGSMVALPLQISGDGRPRCLASLSNFYSIEHGAVAAENADLSAGLTAILSEIGDGRPRWDCLRLGDFSAEDPGFGALLRALRRSGMLVERVPATATWYEETSDLSFAEFFADRPSQLQNTWRRKRHSLNRSGGLRSAFFPDDVDLETAIADYHTVYAASWKPAEPYPRFMPALMALAARLGALRLGIYYIQGIPAAAQFWILYNGRAVIYKLAHAIQFDALSLGTLLTMEMIERVLDRDRPHEINFGRGDDPYKKLWLPRRRQLWRLDAYNPRTPRGLAMGLHREAAKLYHFLRGQQ
jgi:hypothetical protein